MFDGRVGWCGTRTSDWSTAACRRGRLARRCRLVDRKSGGRRVSTLCLRRKPSKTRRNLCERRKAVHIPRYFSPAPAAATCASAVGDLGYEPRRYRAEPLRNRGLDENGVPWRKASLRSSEMGARRGSPSHRSELLMASSRTTATPWALPVSPATSIAATCHLPPLSISKGAPLTPRVPAQLCRNNSRPLASTKCLSIRR